MYQFFSIHNKSFSYFQLRYVCMDIEFSRLEILAEIRNILLNWFHQRQASSISTLWQIQKRKRNGNEIVHIQYLAKKLCFFAIYEAKWGTFKFELSTLKVMLGSWSSSSKQIWIRSFKWGTIRFSMIIYNKVIDP